MILDSRRFQMQLQSLISSTAFLWRAGIQNRLPAPAHWGLRKLQQRSDFRLSLAPLSLKQRSGKNTFSTPQLLEGTELCVTESECEPVRKLITTWENWAWTLETCVGTGNVAGTSERSRAFPFHPVSLKQPPGFLLFRKRNTHTTKVKKAALPSPHHTHKTLFFSFCPLLLTLCCL